MIINLFWENETLFVCNTGDEQGREVKPHKPRQVIGSLPGATHGRRSEIVAMIGILVTLEKVEHFGMNV